MICKSRSPHGTSHKPRHIKECRHFILSMDWVIIYHVGIWILTRNITVSKFVCFNKIMKTYFLIVCMFQQNNEDLLFDSLYVFNKIMKTYILIHVVCMFQQNNEDLLFDRSYSVMICCTVCLIEKIYILMFHYKYSI